MPLAAMNRAKSQKWSGVISFPLHRRTPEFRSRSARGVVTVRSETRDQFGEIVQVLMATLVVPRTAQP
jgi:hypothetical protein